MFEVAFFAIKNYEFRYHAAKFDKRSVRFIYSTRYNYLTMAETISVNKKAILDLVRVKDEFDSIVESLELMADKGFMDSYSKAKEQIKKRDFADWNAL